jgi:hypothetical protein
MFNHFRTLLLNESFAGVGSEHIPSGFVSISLFSSLKNFYKLLFPENSSRFYRSFLTHNYLNLIESAGLSNDLKSFDPRISYDLNAEKDFFKFHRISNISYGSAVDNKNFSLTIKGKYNAQIDVDDHYEHILISQTGVNTVTVQSLVNNKFYLNSSGGTNHTLNFTDNAGHTGPTDFVNIGNTGISFSLYAPTNFATTTKTWEFIIEAPFNFSFDNLNSLLKISDNAINQMLAVTPNFDTSKYENLWKTHFNPVYRVSGLIIAFVSRIDAQFESTGIGSPIEPTTPTTSTFSTSSKSSTSTQTTQPPFFGHLRTTNGRANLKAPIPRTLLGVAQIKQTVTKTQTCVAKVFFTQLRTQTGKGKLTIKVDRFMPCIAFIQGIGVTARIIRGIGSVKNTTVRLLPGTARITSRVIKNQLGKADIKNTVPRTIIGVSRIKVTATKTQTGVASITGGLTTPTTTPTTSTSTISTTTACPPGGFTLSIDPPNGSIVLFPVTVVISTSNGLGTINYTTDGSTPTGLSPVYSGPIQVSNQNTVIKARAVLGDCLTSVSTAQYSISDFNFNFYCDTPDFAGPWGIFHADGDSDYHWQIQFNFGGLTEIVRLEIYQTDVSGVWITGQAWATDNPINPPPPIVHPAFNVYPLVVFEKIAGLSTQLFSGYVSSMGTYVGNHTWDLYGQPFSFLNGYFKVVVYLPDNKKVITLVPATCVATTTTPPPITQTSSTTSTLLPPPTTTTQTTTPTYRNNLQACAACCHVHCFAFDQRDPAGYSASSELPGHELANLFDGDNSTYWAALINNDTPYFTMQLTESGDKVHVTEYIMYSSTNDAGGCLPKDWKLEGSNDGVNWFFLDNQSNITGWTVGIGKTFQVKVTASYVYHKMTILKSSCTSGVTLAELTMYGCVEDVTNDCVLSTIQPNQYTSHISQADADGQAYVAACVASAALLDQRGLCTTTTSSTSTRIFWNVEQICTVDCNGNIISPSLTTTPPTTSTTSTSTGACSISDLISPKLSTFSNANIAVLASVALSGFPSWKAFDGNNLRSDCWDTGDILLSDPTAACDVWLRAKFTTAKTVRAYTVFSETYQDVVYGWGSTPGDWKLEASQDGIIWVVLDTQPLFTNWVQSTGKTFSISNHTAYLYYRLHILHGGGHNSNIKISELILSGC